MESDRIQQIPQKRWLGLDVGGANIKLANGLEFARTFPFPLWKDSDRLAHILEEILHEAPTWDQLAVTMTGELADCFSSKSEGVRHILRSVREAVGYKDFFVYCLDGHFVQAEKVDANPLATAAANWHALARYAARYTEDQVGLQIDIGSTTCDIVPLINQRIVARGMTDTERLVCGELVYCGIERTPVCALVNTVNYRQQSCPVAGEWFATTLDVYLWLDELSEDRRNINTADGGPATKQAARDRLARVVCADPSTFDDADALCLAADVARAQLGRLCKSATQVIQSMQQPVEVVVTSGRGEFLARQVVEHLSIHSNVVSLGGELGPLKSECATAHALAVLAGEECEV